MADSTTTAPEPVQETEIAQPKKSRKGIIVVVIVVLIAVAVAVWWHSTFTEDTDDAQINGHLIQVSSRIAGQVIKVDVEENQLVKVGDTIAELDPKDFDVAVENAQANLANARANAAAANVNIPLTTINTGSTLRSSDADVSVARSGVQQSQQQLLGAQAMVAQAQANLTKANADLERYKPLVEKDVISKQQFDAAVAAADGDKAALANAQASQAAAEDAIRAARDREKQAQAQHNAAETGPQQVAVQSARAKAAEAQVQQAQAQLDQAELNLSYCKIIAPAAGIITRKSVEIDQNVSTGQNLLTLVSLEGLWVTANFKETQLRHMSNGQPVEIKVDATGRTYSGKITEIGGATGSVLSLFPPENATGNYVKVVQRVPVRIDFTNIEQEDASHLLRPGLSVEPDVRVKQ